MFKILLFVFASGAAIAQTRMDARTQIRNLTPSADAGVDRGALVYSASGLAELFGVNSHGEAVGAACVDANWSDCTAVLRKADGTVVNLGYFGIATSPNYAAANSINDAGAIAGDSNGHAVIRAGDGAITDLGHLGVVGATSAYLSALNNRGDAVGQSCTPFACVAILRKADGTILNLGNLGTSSPYANLLSINDAGTSVGWAGPNQSIWPGNTAGIIRNADGTVLNVGLLGVAGASYILPCGVDRAGTSVWLVAAPGTNHTFVRKPDGSLVDLASLGVIANWATISPDGIVWATQVGSKRVYRYSVSTGSVDVAGDFGAPSQLQIFAANDAGALAGHSYSLDGSFDNALYVTPYLTQLPNATGTRPGLVTTSTPIANLAGGSAGQIPVQTAPDATAFATPNSPNGPVVLDSAGNAAIGATRISPTTGLATYAVNGVRIVDGIQYPSIQSAINALPDTGGTVIVPPGYSETVNGDLVLGGAAKPVRLEVDQATINLGNNQLLLYPGSRVLCLSPQASVFNYTGSGVAIQSAAGISSGLAPSTEISRCRVNQSGTSGAGTAISMKGLWLARIQGNSIKGFGTGISGNGADDGSYFSVVEQNTITCGGAAGTGVYLSGGTTHAANRNSLRYNRITSCKTGIQAATGTNIVQGWDVVGNDVEEFAAGTSVGIDWGGDNSTLQANWIESTAQPGSAFTGIRLGGAGNQTLNNKFGLSASGGSVTQFDHSTAQSAQIFEPNLSLVLIGSGLMNFKSADLIIGGDANNDLAIINKNSGRGIYFMLPPGDGFTPNDFEVRDQFGGPKFHIAGMYSAPVSLERDGVAYFGGPIQPGVYTYSNLPASSPDGTFVYCSDCSSSCSSGGGSGSACFREHGQWTHGGILTSAVQSVFGRSGAVTAQSGDYSTDQIAEGASNKYFTNARAQAALSGMYQTPIAGAPGSWPSFATVAASGSYNDLTGKPTIPAAQVQTDWNAATGMGMLLNKPSLATVATSGSYNDLGNKPAIPAAQVQTDWNAGAGIGVLLNKPTLGGAALLNIGTATGTVAAGDDSRITGAAKAATCGANQFATGTTTSGTNCSAVSESQVTNLVADLGGKAASNASTTVNGAVCALGSTCVVTVPRTYAAFCTGTVTSSVTNYVFAGYGGKVTTCADSSGSSASGGMRVTSAGSLKNLYVNLSAAGKNSDRITLLKNGSATGAPTCTFGTGTSCSDVSTVLNVAAGDVVTISVTSGSSDGAANISVSFEVWN